MFKKGKRKVTLYLITFLTCQAVNIIMVLNKMTPIYGSEMVIGIFTAGALGLTSEHFSKEGKE